MKPEHREIIERVEDVRQQLRLNKSRFSETIGMKPQTYNNFIGAQGSKPNIELIAGVVREFSVNPPWLMFGMGEIFLPKDWAKDNVLPPKEVFLGMPPTASQLMAVG